MVTLSGPGKYRCGLFIGNLRSGNANLNGGYFQIQLRPDMTAEENCPVPLSLSVAVRVTVSVPAVA